jgi:hypothetical protein
MMKPEKGVVPIAPTVLGERILAQFHDPLFVGDQGLGGTYCNMRKYVYWKGRRRDKEEFIEKWDASPQHKGSYLRDPVQHDSPYPIPHCIYGRSRATQVH